MGCGFADSAEDPAVERAGEGERDGEAFHLGRRREGPGQLFGLCVLRSEEVAEVPGLLRLDPRGRFQRESRFRGGDGAPQLRIPCLGHGLSYLQRVAAVGKRALDEAERAPDAPPPVAGNQAPACGFVRLLFRDGLEAAVGNQALRQEVDRSPSLGRMEGRVRVAGPHRVAAAGLGFATDLHAPAIPGARLAPVGDRIRHDGPDRVSLCVALHERAPGGLRRRSAVFRERRPSRVHRELHLLVGIVGMAQEELDAVVREDAARLLRAQPVRGRVVATDLEVERRVVAQRPQRRAQRRPPSRSGDEEAPRLARLRPRRLDGKPARDRGGADGRGGSRVPGLGGDGGKRDQDKNGERAGSAISIHHERLQQ